jgi:erythromycin esterase-like protein
MSFRNVPTVNSLIQFGCTMALLLAVSGVTMAQSVSEQLQSQQFNLAADGANFLVNEAARASFLLIGGLHGDQETPALVRMLSARSKPFGYRYIALERSPWAASRFGDFLKQEMTPLLEIRGADIDEIQPHLLIRDLAAINLKNGPLQSMAQMTIAGYRRDLAGQLLQLARRMGRVNDATVGGYSLSKLILRTLEIEATRANKQRFKASTDREQFMKELFISHYRVAARKNAKPKFVVAFGQSHLGRGIDERGVSTLGNFISELAVAESAQSFHVLLFAAGGRYSLHGLHDIDQTKEDAAFALLASLARYPATLFDLRPVRETLHSLPAPLTPVDAKLLYWADSYDAVVCYREVTPLITGPSR